LRVLRLGFLRALCRCGVHRSSGSARARALLVVVVVVVVLLVVVLQEGVAQHAVHGRRQVALEGGAQGRQRLAHTGLEHDSEAAHTVLLEGLARRVHHRAAAAAATTALAFGYGDARHEGRGRRRR
jgi:hypothetical protein